LVRAVHLVQLLQINLQMAIIRYFLLLLLVEGVKERMTETLLLAMVVLAVGVGLQMGLETLADLHRRKEMLVGLEQEHLLPLLLAAVAAHPLSVIIFLVKPLEMEGQGRHPLLLVLR
jgi:hypothetical protein